MNKNPLSFWDILGYLHIIHRCISLKMSCKGVSGLILKCKECGRRYKIDWDDYIKIVADVNIGEGNEMKGGVK